MKANRLAKAIPDSSQLESTVRGSISSALHMAAYIEGDLNDLVSTVVGSGDAQSSSTGLKSVPKRSTMVNDADHITAILSRCQDKLRLAMNALGITQSSKLESSEEVSE